MGLSTKHLTKEQKEYIRLIDKQRKNAISIINNIDKTNL